MALVYPGSVTSGNLEPIKAHGYEKVKFDPLDGNYYGYKPSQWAGGAAAAGGSASMGQWEQITDRTKTDALAKANKDAILKIRDDHNVAVETREYEAEQAAKDAREGAKLDIMSKLGKIAPPQAPADVTKCYRYPMPDPSAGEGGLGASDDYVMFRFYNYSPPFSKERKTTTGKGSDSYVTGDGNIKFESQFAYNQTDYTEVGNPVIMYVPEDISTGYRANWEGKNISSLATDGLRAMARKGFGDKAIGAIQTASNFANRLGPLLSAAALQEATSRLTGDSLSYNDIFGGISGAIMNPNTELLYSGPQLRNFTLNFKLYARHAEEAKHITGIIKQFNEIMLPSMDPGVVMGFNKDDKNEGIRLGFIGVPKLVQVTYMHGGKENPYLPRFKMCALTNIDTNYTPDGAYSVRYDGRPIAHTISLSFQETKVCFAEDIAIGNVR